MSKGKLLSPSDLHSFQLHPRDFLRELNQAATENARASKSDQDTAIQWLSVSNYLVRAINAAPKGGPEK